MTPEARKRATHGMLVAVGMAALVVLATGCPPDQTPPGPVTGFSATAGDAQVLLQWTNPTDADLAGVRIQRKTGGYPTSPTDGTTIFQGTGTQHTDTTAVNGTKYYYVAYAYDTSSNYSTGQQDNATPTSASAQVEILGNYAVLATEIGGIPDNVLDPSQKGQLLAKLDEAELLYRGGQTCEAGAKLEEYLGLAQDFRQGAAVAAAEGLHNLGWMLWYNSLLNLLLKEECPGAERIGIESDATPTEQTNAHLLAAGLFSEPKVQTVDVEYEAGGKAVQERFTQVIIPGAESIPGSAGEPAVPVYRRLIAAPMGSKPVIAISKEGVEVTKTIYMNLVPAQETPIDIESFDPAFGNKPFVKNVERYASDNPYPPDPVTLVKIGDAREVQIYLLEIAAGQFRPKSGKLDLFRNIRVDVGFAGGTGAFLPENGVSPFEPATAVLTNGVLNNLAVGRYIGGIVRPRLTGEEFLILTHPNFLDAANTLATWKQSKGISTRVVTCGTGSGITGRTTKEEIRSYIHTHYDSVFIRPSYILLLGDAEFIAPFYIGSPSSGSDWPYAILGDVGVDVVPDFAVGRIPVDTLDNANQIVNKIVQYEDNPPAVTSFYANAAIASQFQCCRTDVANVGTDQRSFIEVSEFARNVMMNAGKTVQRIYTETVDGFYSGSTTPRRYYDGTLLPGDLGAGSSFAWNGSTADILSAYAAGKFLIMHRDHGGTGGWSHPSMTTANANALTNGPLYPVVFSVNCSSGYFDNETSGGSFATEYFAERLLRNPNGGAVGVLGDTRDSPSWENSTLAQGFFDAIWPNAVPTYGDATSKRRLGDILNHGKMYLMSKVGFSVMGEVIQEAKTTFDVYIWSCLGDPTLELWTHNPNLVALPATIKYRLLLSGINLEYGHDGATIDVFQADPKTGETTPLARGVIRDGVATLPFYDAYNAQLPLHFSASLEDSVSKPLEGKAAE